MAGITQVIPTYVGGMSEQPDHTKSPGQVKNIINGIPDVTYGLFKRPGSKRVGTDPLTNVQSGGSWFHYYRDEAEGSYIGQVDSTGNVRIWKASGDNAGAEQTIAYGTGGEAAIKTYLSTSNTEDIQALTINDTTFFNNRSIAVTTTGTTDTRLISTGKPENQAYIELRRTENGRQYGFNVSRPNETATVDLRRATRIKIKSDTLQEGVGTGNCPGIGTQVFSVSGTDYTGSTFAGSATFTTSDDGGTNNKVTVTFTGHGYKTGDQVNVSGTITDTKVEITKVDANSFYYVLPIDQNKGDHTDASCTIASPHTDKTNLIFRLITLGQVSTEEEDPDSFICTYNREIDLLHGGEGWAVGDTIAVTLDQAKGGGGVGTDNTDKADYTIEVLEIETAKVVADVKLARPTPTPFDSDTAVTADTILGGIQTELDSITVNDADGANPKSLNVQIIGNGLFFSCENPFNIEIAEQDLMRVMQKTINDVTELPNQCKDGYIVKVANARMSDEDDYYLKFTGDNGDGTGAWSECAAPNIVKSFNASTMPHVIQRTSIANQGTSSELATFTVKQFTWGDREVGDDNTNPIPTFVSIRSGHPDYTDTNIDSYISKVLFFRNRLAILSGENVTLCKPGTLASPDFWAETALTTSSVDPIDIACSSIFPSDLFDGIEINTGLLVFSSNQQFLLSSDDTVLNPDTAKLRSIATYNYSVDIPPISLGTTVGYVDNSGKYSRFNQMTNITREGEPTVAEVSKVVPSLLPKDIDIITNSRENQIVLLGKTGSDIIYGLKYFNTGEKQIQTAWFKWKLNNNLLYHFIIDDVYYYLDEDNFLQTINLVQSETDISINKDDVNYQIHLDNYVTGITGGSFNTNANTTTFYADWISKVTTPSGSLVIADGTGSYATGTVNGDYVTVNGDWSDTTSTHFSVTDYNEYIDTFFGADTSNTRSAKGVTFDGSTLSITFDRSSTSGATGDVEWGVYSSIGFEKNIQCSAQYLDTGYSLTHAFGLTDNPPEKHRGVGMPAGSTLDQIDYNWTLDNSSAGLWISGSSIIASSNTHPDSDDPALIQVYHNAYNPARITTNVEPLDVYKPDTDVFKITYDGEYVRWYQNGREKHRLARSVGNKLYFESSLASPEYYGSTGTIVGTLKNVKFESLTPGYVLGYLYDYQVDFPTLYVSTSRGEVTRTDVNASLTLHRLNFNFGKVGSYETTLTRLGKDPYTEIYESANTNLYEATDAPYLEEAIKTIPVYERNKNVDITLKSTSPTPATLHSMSWEGDYSTKYYKRV